MRQKAFTLIQLMIALGLTALVGVMATQLYLKLERSSKKSAIKRGLEKQHANALLQLKRLLSDAVSVDGSSADYLPSIRPVGDSNPQKTTALSVAKIKDPQLKVEAQIYERNDDDYWLRLRVPNEQSQSLSYFQASLSSRPIFLYATQSFRMLIQKRAILPNEDSQLEQSSDSEYEYLEVPLLNQARAGTLIDFEPYPVRELNQWGYMQNVSFLQVQFDSNSKKLMAKSDSGTSLLGKTVRDAEFRFLFANRDSDPELSLPEDPIPHIEFDYCDGLCGASPLEWRHLSQVFVKVEFENEGEGISAGGNFIPITPPAFGTSLSTPGQSLNADCSLESINSRCKPECEGLRDAAAQSNVAEEEWFDPNSPYCICAMGDDPDSSDDDFPLTNAAARENFPAWQTGENEFDPDGPNRRILACEAAGNFCTGLQIDVNGDGDLIDPYSALSCQDRCFGAPTNEDGTRGEYFTWENGKRRIDRQRVKEDILKITEPGFEVDEAHFLDCSSSLLPNRRCARAASTVVSDFDFTNVWRDRCRCSVTDRDWEGKRVEGSFHRANIFEACNLSAFNNAGEFDVNQVSCPGNIDSEGNYRLSTDDYPGGMLESSIQLCECLKSQIAEGSPGQVAPGFTGLSSVIDFRQTNPDISSLQSAYTALNGTSLPTDSNRPSQYSAESSFVNYTLSSEDTEDIEPSRTANCFAAYANVETELACCTEGGQSSGKCTGSTTINAPVGLESYKSFCHPRCKPTASPALVAEVNRIRRTVMGVAEGECTPSACPLLGSEGSACGSVAGGDDSGDEAQPALELQ